MISHINFNHATFLKQGMYLMYVFALFKSVKKADAIVNGM